MDNLKKVPGEVTTVKDFFRPLEFICTCCGIYINPASRTRYRVLQTTVCAVFTILAWLEVARHMYIVTLETMMSGTMLALIAYAAMELMSATATTITPIMMAGRHRRFIEDLSQHSATYETVFVNWGKSRRHLICGLVLSALISLSFITMLAFIYFFTDSAVVRKAYGLEQFNINNVAALCCLHFVRWFLVSRLVYTYLYFGVSIYCLHREFNFIGKEINSLVKFQTSIDASLSTMRRRFESACSMVSTVSGIFSAFTLVIYAFVIPIICFVVYGLIMGKFNSYDVFVLTDLICLALIHLCLITKVGIVLRNKIEEPLDALYAMDLGRYTSTTLEQISMFIHRISNSQIGISVGGLFVIDTSTVLMLIGTIITYAIVVLQMKPSHCQEELVRNATEHQL